ncbi:MAG: phosphoglycolate phosphatase-like HAD superfamily hydrolase [Salibacteraceae bacterium]|jgi:phosphoglycolate phosphatase-like HAD superfamily hydrolase
MLIKNIFFDFDGVLAESVSAKTDAFKEMYLSHGLDIAERVVDYHINHGGVSRFEKFRHWEKEFFGKELSDAELEQMANRFSELVLQKVIDSKAVSDSLWFLKKYAKTLRFWIITGTPTIEIKKIAKARGIDHFFEGLHGSPENKRYWSEYLLDTFDLNRTETLFLGDATTDMDAAQFSQLHFALRHNEENKELFTDYKGLEFEGFKELEKVLIEQKMLQ